MSNEKLRSADKNKNDEFYTQYADIQKEINAYLEYNPNVFRDKTILLPCDDPEWSNFTRFFAQNFESLGLKKLISTSFATDSKKFPSIVQLSFFELESPKYDKNKTNSHGKIFTLTRDKNNSGKIDIDDLEWEYLKGDGDFRSEEVKKLREEADIIITNPPFSLFREFLDWINVSNKQFAVIGNINAITYKEVFPLIKNNEIWLGATNFNNGMYFYVPDNFQYADSYKFERVLNGKAVNRVPGVCWFTNIEHGRRHQPLSLMSYADNLKFSKHKELKGQEYQKFDFYDAINVPFSDSIPDDYDGCMGVPITFLDKYCPEQFEIIDGIGRYSILTNEETKKAGNYLSMVNGKPQYFRIIIKKKV